MNLTWPGHLAPRHACQPREDPPSGRRRGGVGDVVRHGLMVRGDLRSTAAWRHGVDQQRPRHHHAQPGHPVGLCDTQRRDHQQRIVAKPTAPCTVRLTVVGGTDLGRAPGARVARGPQDTAGLDVRVVRHRRVIRTAWGLELPRDGLEWGPRGGSPGAGVVWGCAPGIRRDAVLRPVWGPRRQGRVGGPGRTHAVGVPVHAWRGAGLMVARRGVGEWCGGALQGRRRRPPPPTRGPASGAHRTRLSAGGVSTRRPGIPPQSVPAHL
jgi:hypothetical protein